MLQHLVLAEYKNGFKLFIRYYACKIINPSKYRITFRCCSAIQNPAQRAIFLLENKAIKIKLMVYK